MNKADTDMLAQFASTWRGSKHDPSLRARLRLDLAEWCDTYCEGFDRVEFWLVCQEIDNQAKSV